MASPIPDVTEAIALKTPPAYIFRCLEIEEGIFVAPELHTEMEERARVAMAKSTLKRLTDPSLPPELHLGVMATGVQYSTTHWHADLLENMDAVRDAAFSSLLPSELWDPASRCFNQTWLDEQGRRVLAETAE